MTLTLADQTLVLHSEKVVSIEGSTTALVVADLHLGKSAAFRARGLAVPEGDTDTDLQRLRTLVLNHRPTHLILAGDLFHSPAGLTPEVHEAVESWLDALPCAVTLVVGNHDAKLRHFPQPMTVVPELLWDGITIVHDPADAPDGPAICGHLHPVVRIADGKRTRLRLPCFHLHQSLLTLPAFGSFTGGRIIEPAPGDRVFVAPAERVIEVPPALWR